MAGGDDVAGGDEMVGGDEMAADDDDGVGGCLYDYKAGN